MTQVSSPLTGRAIGLAAVPDAVFSGATVGPGTAVDPASGVAEAVAPIGGLVISLQPHAFVVVDDEGHGVLTHLGIGTVQLNGEGFEPLVAKGDRVGRGQPLVRWDPAAVAEAGKSPFSPVVALNAGKDALSAVAEGEIRAGEPLFTWE